MNAANPMIEKESRKKLIWLMMNKREQDMKQRDNTKKRIFAKFFAILSILCYHFLILKTTDDD